jgi:hypothetical protein
VRDASALAVRGDGSIGEGARWTGRIAASFDEPHFVIYGHLWPIDTPAVANPEVVKVTRPYYGLHGEYRSKCMPGCGHPDEDFTISDKSFAFHPGMALVCGDGVVRARAVIRIETTFTPGSRVEGMEKLPDLVDAHSLEPITSGWLMPGDNGEPSATSRWGCFSDVSR